MTIGANAACRSRPPLAAEGGPRGFPIGSRRPLRPDREEGLIQRISPSPFQVAQAAPRECGPPLAS